MAQPLLVTGAVPLNPAQAPNRIEINQFILNEVHFSLFVQALDGIYSDAQGSLTSFFQLAGIHGLPYVQWNQSGGSNVVANSAWPGYCMHGTTLFPTWHRPFVALFEQVIQQRAATIAQTYVPAWQQAYMTGAASLRLPYWDWAANIMPPDAIIASTTVTIRKPDGFTHSVPNPFLAYTFNPGPPPASWGFYAPYSLWTTTLRHPSDDTATATSRIVELRSSLLAERAFVRTNTYNTLTTVNDWADFSNHTANPLQAPPLANSLETIHDTIHGTIGGTVGTLGDMSDPSVAAFDPIFWLHHANVDRMLSLWSALHPNVWVSPGTTYVWGSSWTLPQNAPIDATTDLTPFWRTATTYWKSSDLDGVDSAPLGYTYPEFNGLDLNNMPALTIAIKAKVDALYGPTVPITAVLSPAPTKGLAPPKTLKRKTSKVTLANGHFSLTDDAPAGAPGVPQGDSSNTSASSRPTIVSQGGRFFLSVSGSGRDSSPSGNANQAAVPHAAWTDWTAHVRVEKFALNGSFTVFFFLGNGTDPVSASVPADPREWHTAPSFAGTYFVFANGARQRCGNCVAQADAHQLVEGFVHLNTNKQELAGMSVAQGKRFLREHLTWRVAHPTRHPVRSGDIPSLSVTVGATPMWAGPADTVPARGQVQWFPEVTEGHTF
ncbi:Photo-regulated tyrosinase [Mycena kentingensis (nom. inval.)]|nr:Photo-regulated tyrosinase [Mycena kentingensis (nom. inval.)]